MSHILNVHRNADNVSLRAESEISVSDIEHIDTETLRIKDRVKTVGFKITHYVTVGVLIFQHK